jgi:hypothetical protein
MLNEKLKLINEQTSPLFRVLSVYNTDNPQRRAFANNICAFHIGGGRILSVSHNLRAESGVVNIFDEKVWQMDIATRIDSQHPLIQQYQFDPTTDQRYLLPGANLKLVSDTLRQINFDSRWITLYQKRICRPALIIHFAEDAFYKDKDLSESFSSLRRFHEPGLSRYTYILELELIKSFDNSDMALYRIVNADQKLISKLPVIEPDYDIYDSGEPLYCLQSSPGSALGRLLNNATIEGFLDHHQHMNDRIGGNYIHEGLRYLIRGYFRFGSSGAPYVRFDGKSFKAVAVQSEASPIQLSINNNREGNFQYVNAIAVPLKNIQDELTALI